MNGIQYHSNFNPNQVDFSYSISGAISSFKVTLYYSADGLLDGSDIGVFSQYVTVDAGANPHSGSFQFLGAVPGDPNRPYLIAVADPDNAIAESDETDNVSNTLLRPTVSLTTDASVYTLMDTSTITAAVNTPLAGSALIQGTRTGADSWTRLGYGPTLNYVQRIAGQFTLDSYVTVGNVRFDSTYVFVTVRFPSYTQIIASPSVQDFAIEAWNNTLAYAQNNAGAPDATGAYPNSQRREAGFWITLDTSTGRYQRTTTDYGPAVGPNDGAYVNLSGKPADQKADPQLSDGSAIYLVASFHTHTPSTYRQKGRAVGPSGTDQNIDNQDNVVGIVYDYIGVGGNAPAGFPLRSLAQLYPSGPTRRSTP